MKKYSLLLIVFLIIFFFVLVFSTFENTTFAADAEDYLSAKYNPFSSYQWSSGYSLSGISITKYDNTYEYQLGLTTNRSASSVIKYLTKLTGDTSNDENGGDPVSWMEQRMHDGAYNAVVFLGNVGGTYAHVQAEPTHDDNSGYHVTFTAKITSNTTALETAINNNFNRDLFYFEGIPNPFIEFDEERKGFWVDYTDKNISSFYQIDVGDELDNYCEYFLSDTFTKAMEQNFDVKVNESNDEINVAISSDDVIVNIHNFGETLIFNQQYEGMDIPDVSVPASTTSPSNSTVEKIPIESIEITPRQLSSLNVNAGLDIFAHIYPKNATYYDNIIWTSSNREIASISDSGYLEAKSGGVVSIKASNLDGSVYDIKIIKVIEEDIQKIYLGDTYVLHLGYPLLLNTGVFPHSAASKKLIYKSDDTTIVAIDANGTMYPNGIGTTYITVSSEGGAVSARAAVRVYPSRDNIEEMYVDPTKVTSKLNVYETPGGKIYASIPAREKVIVKDCRDEVVDGYFWVLIEYGDINGWVKADYLIDDLPNLGTNGKYFNQFNIYDNGKKVSGGCYITCYAMLINNLGISTTPQQIYNEIGTVYADHTGIAREYGFTYVNVEPNYPCEGKSEDALLNHIRNLIIQEYKKYPQGIIVYFERNDGSNHAMLVTGYDGTTIYFHDPAKGKNLPFDQTQICKDRREGDKIGEEYASRKIDTIDIRTLK